MVSDIKNVNTTVTQRKIIAKQQTIADSKAIEEKPEKDEETVKQRKTQYVCKFERFIYHRLIETFAKRICLLK
jgi:hypothetical protein